MMTSDGGSSWRVVGRKIRSLRKDNGLTLKQLSCGCGLSANTISLIEHGQVAPTIESLCKIAHALGVPTGSLFDDACENPEPGESDDVCAPVCASEPQSLFEPRSGASVPAGARSVAAVPGGEPDAPLQRRVMCVSGCLVYETDHARYTLVPGDSLVFTAAAGGEISGSWRCAGDETAVVVMILPARPREREHPAPGLAGGRLPMTPHR